MASLFFNTSVCRQILVSSRKDNKLVLSELCNNLDRYILPLTATGLIVNQMRLFTEWWLVAEALEGIIGQGLIPTSKLMPANPKIRKI